VGIWFPEFYSQPHRLRIDFWLSGTQRSQSAASTRAAARLARSRNGVAWAVKRGRKRRIPQTIGVRFSLDETFDIGKDTGSSVLEEYADKMPFHFYRHAHEIRCGA